MAMTPTEWYTSLPGIGSVGAPGDRRPAGGGGGGRGSPLMSKFQSRRRELQNLLAEEQLKLMKEKLKQARGETRDRITDRGNRLLDPIKEQYARMNTPRPPRRAETQTSFADAAEQILGNLHPQLRKPFDVRRMSSLMRLMSEGKVNPQGLGMLGSMFGGQQRPGGGGGSFRGAITDPTEPEAPVSMSGRPGKRAYPTAITRVGMGGVPLPGREKGGTIPKTGPYELHKGEIVVSADQVDRPLLAALKKDKLSKMHSGQMDGKGTGPGVPTSKSMVKDEFRGGTLHSYQAGTGEEDYTSPLARMIAYLTGKEAEPSPGGPVGPQFPAGRDVSEMRPEIWDQPWFREGLAGLPAEPEPPAPGSEEETSALLAEAIGEASPARPYPQPSFEESSDEYKEKYMQNVARRGDVGARPMTNYAAGGVDPEAQVMDELLAMGDDPGYQQEMMDRQGAAANEATFARAAAGDRGLGEAGPLSIERGGPLPEELRGEQTWTEMMADPKQRKADRDRLMATLNEQKADRLQDYLAANAGEMDPQTFKSITDQANQLKAINKGERDRQTLKDEAAQDRIVEMEKVLGDYQGQLARAQATGQASANVGLRQAERDLRGKLERYEFKFLESVEAGASRDVLEAYSEAMFEIKAELEGFGRGDEGYEEAHDAFMNYQMSVLGEQ